MVVHQIAPHRHAKESSLLEFDAVFTGPHAQLRLAWRSLAPISSSSCGESGEFLWPNTPTRSMSATVARLPRQRARALVPMLLSQAPGSLLTFRLRSSTSPLRP